MVLGKSGIGKPAAICFNAAVYATVSIQQGIALRADGPPPTQQSQGASVIFWLSARRIAQPKTPPAILP